MNKSIKIKIILLFISFFLSCNENATKDFQLHYMKNELKEFTIEDSKNFIDSNKIELERIYTIFIESKSLRMFIRRDINSILIIPGINHPVKSYVKYNILSSNEDEINITLNTKQIDEDQFWENDYTEIRDFDNPDLSLKIFLDSNQISKTEFVSIVDFIRRNNVSLITKLFDYNIVKFYFSITQGILYSPTEFLWGKIESTTNVDKIDEDYYYFEEVF